jgi:hypothetical protein
MQNEWRNQFLKTDWSQFHTYIIYCTGAVHQNYKHHRPSRIGILQSACTVDHRKWHSEIAHAHLPQFTNGEKFLKTTLTSDKYGCTISLFKYDPSFTLKNILQVARRIVHMVVMVMTTTMAVIAAEFSLCFSA